MKKTLLFLLLITFSIAGFSETWIITNEGLTFSPDSIAIEVGDDVTFDIGSIHDAVEVSQETWEANGNTPLDGGFSVGFGGGTVSADQLPAGTHYYVCEPHASLGMKGMIVVINTTGIPVNPLKTDISVYPNPSQGKFQVDIVDSQFTNEFSLEIYDIKGQKIYATTQKSQQTSVNLDLSEYPAGIYFIRLSEGNLQYKRKILIK